MALTISTNMRADLTQDPTNTDENQDKRQQFTNFNNCFLATLQKQKNLLMARRRGERLNPSHRLIDEKRLMDMGDGIVNVCSILEKHGLVDYELGVWEEDIITRQISPPFPAACG